MIDRATHDLVGVAERRGFFRKVKYGQIVPENGRVRFHPSRQGALQADLPVFEALPDEMAELGACLRRTIDASR